METGRPSAVFGLFLIAMVNFVSAGVAIVCYVIVSALMPCQPGYRPLGYAGVLLGLLICVLQIVNGIGILHRRRFTDRILGNALMVFSIVSIIAVGVLEGFKDTTIYQLLGVLFYPSVILVVLNGPYRNLFVFGKRMAEQRPEPYGWAGRWQWI